MKVHFISPYLVRSSILLTVLAFWIDEEDLLLSYQ
jgi:hypothetical protein